MNNGYCELEFPGWGKKIRQDYTHRIHEQRRNASLSFLVGVSLKRTVLLKIESLNVKTRRKNLTYFKHIPPCVYPRFRLSNAGGMRSGDYDSHTFPFYCPGWAVHELRNFNFVTVK